MPSILSLSAAVLYAVVAFACLVASRVTTQKRQMDWHFRSWLLLAGFFIVLGILRIWSLEEIIRDDLRAALKSGGAYEERRGFQRPLVAAMVGLIGLATLFWAQRAIRFVRGRRNVAIISALTSGAVMLGLVALRIISLSPIDALLFRGLKLNWILDIGSSLIVFSSASYYSFVVSQPSESTPLEKRRRCD